MSTLLDRIAALRTLPEMREHITAIIRNFPVSEWRDVAEELIDRAERRGAITPDMARELAAEFVHANA